MFLLARSVLATAFSSPCLDSSAHLRASDLSLAESPGNGASRRRAARVSPNTMIHPYAP
jgi:hypothetical protein